MTNDTGIRRHRFEPLSLVVGLILLVGVGMWIAWEHDDVTTDQLLLVMPIALIVIGVVGVAGSFVKPRTRPVPPPAADEPEQTPADRTDDPDDTAVLDEEPTTNDTISNERPTRE